MYPNAFKTGILGREAIGGVLLYGPPGTGKTMVCRALARECGARMLQVRPSDVMDMYVGQSEKQSRAIFVSLILMYFHFALLFTSLTEPRISTGALCHSH
jgi:SpoVK/Ycf46/Vps4 family AAA+-type ATPase